MLNHGVAAGSGGGGMKLQSAAGFVRIAPVVVCDRVFETEYVQSQAVIVPGALDVLPLNVQLIVLPASVNVHVSVSVGPVTPKFAVATVGGVTERDAVRVAPPYDPVTVTVAAALTTLVVTENVALVVPAGTVTFAATVAGSFADRPTTAPLDGAGSLSVTVPVIAPPPTMLDAPRDSAVSDAPVTVSVGDWLLAPLTDAVIVAVPAATAVTVIAAVVAPACTVTGVCTVATAVLLLERATLVAAVGAAFNVMVPWSVLPALAVVALRVTPLTVGPVDGAVELEEPQPAAITASSAIAETERVY